MKRLEWLMIGLVGLVCGCASDEKVSDAPRHPEHPNFILILCDDLGYGDIGPYGGSIPTPALDRMALQGLVATDYYSPANLCTPARAGILTGRYPIRTGLGYEVILVEDERQLPLAETTIAEALKPDYATGFFGKWHLGHTGADWMPTKHGFDAFVCIPYSHDVLGVPVYEGDVTSDDVTQAPANLPDLQQQFYASAERFIESHADQPFFVELALSTPHLPDRPHASFEHTSSAGSHGDVIREIDSIVGRLLNDLKGLGLDRDTVVVFTSDNGAGFEGSNGPLRDRKGAPGFDGGYRVPFIAWAPERVRAKSRTSAIISGIDLLPTLVHMAGLELPESLELDGLDISEVLTRGAASPHEQLLLFDRHEQVAGIRTQRWKYVPDVELGGRTFSLEQGGYGALLFDISRDPSESYSLEQSHPDVAWDMRQRLEQARGIFGPLMRGSAAATSSEVEAPSQHSD